MKCPYCGSEELYLNKYYRHLETYKSGGGSIIVSFPCCGYSVKILMSVSFEIFTYEGDAKEDDWGNLIKKYKH